MNPEVVNIAGWLPAIIFPAATLIQLIAILRSNSIEGVSPLTWTLFGIANIAVYIYTEKYLAPQTMIGFLGTAVLDFIIAANGDTTPKLTEVLSWHYPSPNNLNFLNDLPGINSGFEHAEGNDLNVWRTIAPT